MQSNIPTSKSSTSLVSNANTISSTMPLNPRQTPHKDFAAALGDLQSRYGIAANHNPISTPVVKQKKQAKDASPISPAQSTSGSSKGAASHNNNDSGLPSPEGLNKRKGASKFLPWIGK